MYEHWFEHESNLLRLRLTGFWTADVMSRFADELTSVVKTLEHSAPDFAILSDCRVYPVQSAEVGAAWARLLGPDTLIRAPYAVLVGSALNKMQAGRALTAPNVRVFTAMEAASAWLDEQRGAKAR